MVTKVCATEHQEAKALMQLVRVYESRMPELAYLYAIPNGGHRNPVAAAKMKAEGVKPGVPDYCLAYPKGEFHGLYIELKRRHDGETSKEQRGWIERLRAVGYRAEVAEGATAAWEILLDYLGVKSYAHVRSTRRGYADPQAGG